MRTQQSVDDRIAETTLQLLRSGGPVSVTVEAVAAASRVAKTTIYRRYHDRREMLAAALERLAATPPPDTGSDAPARLKWLITNAIAMVHDGIGLGGLAALLTRDDPDFTTSFQEILRRQRAVLASAIEHGKADGSWRADIDGATLIDAVVGAYIAEHARREAIAPGLPDRLFALFWPAVAPTAEPSGLQ